MFSSVKDGKFFDQRVEGFSGPDSLWVFDCDARFFLAFVCDL